MASIIKLKRSNTPASVPSLLAEGELAVNLFDRKLFIGGENGGANVVSVSGDQYNFTSSSGGADTAVLTLTVDNVSLSNDSIQIVGGTGIGVAEDSGVITITNTGGSNANNAFESPLTFNGTSSEVDVARSGNTVTIGLTNDVSIANDLTVGRNGSIAGDLQVDGALTVTGATTYISSSTVNVDDSMLKLSANNVADTVDHGVYAKYVDGSTEKYAGYFRDSSDNSTFKFYKDLEVEPTTTVNIAAQGYTLAKIEAVIDGGTY